MASFRDVVYALQVRRIRKGQGLFITIMFPKPGSARSLHTLCPQLHSSRCPCDEPSTLQQPISTTGPMPHFWACQNLYHMHHHAEMPTCRACVQHPFCTNSASPPQAAPEAPLFCTLMATLGTLPLSNFCHYQVFTQILLLNVLGFSKWLPHLILSPSSFLPLKLPWTFFAQDSTEIAISE